MELLAVIAGLEAIKKYELPVTVYSDSQYIVNSVEKGWLKTWIKNELPKMALKLNLHWSG